MSIDFKGEVMLENHVEDKCSKKVLYGMGLKLVNGEWKWTNKRDEKETQKRMTMGVEDLEDQLSLLKKEVFKISKLVIRIGEKLKIDMGLNSDEEDKGCADTEDEDEDSQDVLGSDEDNDSEDAETLEIF
ncbi:hypothetical protein LIER_38124 [Lithospermum erythrorhizon]|uniref:Uncharacterized protein n=1 Tax=Lithospermum erythrorhizon TaxID=34254 RepID=A0AAV3PX66_LITER